MVCPSCKTPIPPGAQYCFVCGARVAVSSTPSAPPQLAERKFVTVVFIDMVGSLSAIQDKDPEDAHEVLASALGVMTQAVHAYGGVVTERQGDGIMAVFGAPAALEDHAARACHAALRLHSMVQHDLAGRFSIRIGMNSGEVAVGSALSDFANDYTATGAVVHIAARLQSLAAPNSTVMTAQTAALVRETMRTESIWASVLKGLETPVEIHRLVGPLGRHTRPIVDANAFRVRGPRGAAGTDEGHPRGRPGRAWTRAGPQRRGGRRQEHLDPGLRFTPASWHLAVPHDGRASCRRGALQAVRRPVVAALEVGGPCRNGAPGSVQESNDRARLEPARPRIRAARPAGPRDSLVQLERVGASVASRPDRRSDHPRPASGKPQAKAGHRPRGSAAR